MNEASARSTGTAPRFLDDLRIRPAGLLLLLALLPMLALAFLLRGAILPAQGGTLVAATGGIAIIAIVAALLGARQLVAPLASLERDLRATPADGQVPVTGSAQIAAVRRAINALTMTVGQGTRQQAARGALLQTQIVTLLEEIGSVAEGDLTAEAAVSTSAVGPVADSFNYMIAELRRIVGRVNAATEQVSSSTDQLLTTTDTLGRSAEQQAASIAHTSAAIEEMAVSIGQVVENATRSSDVARSAREAAEAGTRAVTATVAGMTRIRGQVQETSKRIKRLGESSQEIGQAIQVIEEIARRTNRLALNAAIQAAMAGEHGRGFAVVAEEVRRLAERTSHATGQIAELVGAIQSETTSAVIAMEDGTREVVAGSRLADAAGQSLGEIDRIVGQLAELIEAISLAADQQARASGGIARAMGELSQVTQGTAAGSHQVGASIASLAALADDLRESVATFRLGPGGRTNGRATAHQGAHGQGNRNGYHLAGPSAPLIVGGAPERN
jgi:methyl-accepting chemotaxis protein